MLRFLVLAIIVPGKRGTGLGGGLGWKDESGRGPFGKLCVLFVLFITVSSIVS